MVTECEVCDALKQVGLNKSPILNGLPYEVYLRLPHMFVPILTDMFNQGRNHIAEDRWQACLGGIRLLDTHNSAKDRVKNFVPGLSEPLTGYH